MRQELPIIGAVWFALALVFAAASPAAAQMSNEPYSFRGGSSGMSNAARQAIIEEKLTGATPRNLLRGPGDQLLDVQEGPGHSAIVRESDGTVLPGYRGASVFRPGMRAGIFNAFFLTGGSGGSRTTPFFAGGFGTRAGLAGWTGMVSGSGSGAIPTGASPIDAWTNQVFIYYGP